MENQHYNLKETAEILGIAVRTVREWVKKGKIKAKKYKQCSMWFVSKEEIERLQREME